MRRDVRTAATMAGVLLAVGLLVWQAGGLMPAARAQSPPEAGDILLVYGVGGVLTRDGTLWQYRPDKGVWLNVDQAFAEEGRTTNVLPLPVSAADIARMDSFGFIVTKAGDCWLYDLEKDEWRRIGPPPAGR